MVQRTLVLLKPDAVARGLVGRILTRFEDRGFSVVAVQLRQAPKDLLARHYRDLVDKPFYGGIEGYMTSGPLLAVVLEGEDVVQCVRTMMGATMPQDAAPGTIRGDFCTPDSDGVVRNAVHGSDSVESAEREISLWFPTL